MQLLHVMHMHSLRLAPPFFFVIISLFISLFIYIFIVNFTYLLIYLLFFAAFSLLQLHDLLCNFRFRVRTGDTHKWMNRELAVSEAVNTYQRETFGVVGQGSRWGIWENCSTHPNCNETCMAAGYSVNLHGATVCKYPIPAITDLPVAWV